MSDHLTPEQLADLFGEKLGEEERGAVQRHLDDCAPCREALVRLDAVKPLVGAFASWWTELAAEARQAPEHLPYEQLAALVDGTLDDIGREIAGSHLELCEQCRAEKEELERLRTMMTPYAGKVYAPAPSPPWWDRAAAALTGTPARRVALQGAGVLVVAALCAWLVARPLQDQISGLRAENSRLEQANRTLRQQVASAPTHPALQQEIARRQAAEARLTELRRQTEQREQRFQNRLHELQARLAVPQPTPPAPAPAPGGAGQPAAVQLAVNDAGGRVTLDRQGHVTGLGPLRPHLENGVRLALLENRLTTPRGVETLPGVSGSLMGTGATEKFRAVSPIREIVRADRPTFRWSSQPGATGYTVAVTDDNYERIAGTEKPVIGTEWTPAKPLPAGRVLIWTVTAHTGAEDLLAPTASDPEARFILVALDMEAELRRAERQQPRSHLLLGLLYSRAGLLEQAEQQLRRFQQANPDSPPARKLLAQVRELRKRQTFPTNDQRPTTNSRPRTPAPRNR